LSRRNPAGDFAVARPPGSWFGSELLKGSVRLVQADQAAALRFTVDGVR
jgi:hypothetical protein